MWLKNNVYPHIFDDKSLNAMDYIASTATTTSPIKKYISIMWYPKAKVVLPPMTIYKSHAVDVILPKAY